MHPAREPVAEINLNLEAPERDAKKLGSLHVKAEVTIPAGIKTFKFPSLAQKDVTVKQGDVSLTLEDTEVDEQVWKVNVTLVYPGEGPAFESYRQGLFNNRLWLQRADGSRFEHNGGFSNTGSDGGKLGFEYLFVDAPGKPADYQLVYETPEQGDHDPARVRVQGRPAAVKRPITSGAGRASRRQRRDAFELGSLEAVFLELLGHAPPRQAAVACTPRDVSLVLRQAGGRSTRARPGRSSRRSGRAASARCRAASWMRRAAERPRGDRFRQVVAAEHRAVGQGDPRLDRVFQLADVARPVVPQEGLHRVGGDLGDRRALLGAVLLEEMHRQERNILGSLAQRGQVDPDHVEPVEQVGAEPALLDLFFQYVCGWRRRSARRPGCSRSRPLARTCRVCKTRSSLACRPGEMSPTSSSSKVPPSASSNRPILRRSAPVNAPFS